MSVIGEKLVAIKKNYEMIRFKANLKPQYSKHDHPLSKMRNRDNLQINADAQPEQKIEEIKASPQDEDKDEGQEKETKSEDLSVWLQRRIAVMKDFEREFGDMEVFLNEGRDRDIDRPIRMGKVDRDLINLRNKKAEKYQKLHQ